MQVDIVKTMYQWIKYQIHRRISGSCWDAVYN